MYNLIAKNPCIMADSKRQALTVGKKYKVHGTDEKYIYIIDDDQEEHLFDHNEVDMFFESILNTLIT